MSSSLAPDLQGFFLLLSLLAWSSGLLFIWWLLILSSKLLLAEARFNFCFLPPEDPKLAPALTYTIRVAAEITYLPMAASMHCMFCCICVPGILTIAPVSYDFF